jgi:hypothetical protein
LAAHRFELDKVKEVFMNSGKLSLIVAVVLILSGNRAHGGGDPWNFTSSEIEVAYRYQTEFGRRLSHPLKPAGCFHGQTEFGASFQGKSFLAPCRFITETLRHLKEVLRLGATRYLFPLDTDHAHLVVPMDVWKKKYSRMPLDNVLPVLLGEPALAAVYHAAEHLTVQNLRTGDINLQAKSWKEKRNALGFYDGRALQILAPRADGLGRSDPAGYREVTTFNFLAHRLGELVFSSSGQAFTIDISFDDDFAVALP